MSIRISVKPSAVAWALGGAAALFVLVSTVGQVIRYVTGHNELMGLIKLTYVDEERNFPTLFSVLLLAIASLSLLVATVLARAEKSRDAWRWGVLCVGFLYLAFDEGIELHERLNATLSALLHVGGSGESRTPIVFWIVRGLAAAIVLVILFWGFLRRLPARTRSLFVLAGACYLGGAALLDTIGLGWGRAHGKFNAAYVTIVTVEESLEMAGVIILIYAVLDYLARRYREIGLILADGESRNAPPPR